MTSFRQSVNRPVISKSNAQQVGKLQRFVVDSATRRVTALLIGGNKRHAALVDLADVASFGADAVIVPNPEVVRESSSPEEELVAANKTPILDQLVLNTLGDEVGVLSDVEFDADDGVLVSFTIGELQIDAGNLRGIGPYAVVVTP